jgi:hypothetical protein
LKICSLAFSFLAQSTACIKAVLACSEKSVQIRIFLYSDIDHPGRKNLYDASSKGLLLVKKIDGMDAGQNSRMGMETDSNRYGLDVIVAQLP